MRFIDRVPKAGKAGMIKIKEAVISGDQITGILEHADEATVQGTLLNADVLNKLEEDLKAYLVDEILEEHGKHSSDSGTIKNKLSFCKAVIANIDDFNMLSDEAKQLTEKIYNFIEENNK